MSYFLCVPRSWRSILLTIFCIALFVCVCLSGAIKPMVAFGGSSECKWIQVKPHCTVLALAHPHGNCSNIWPDVFAAANGQLASVILCQPACSGPFRLLVCFCLSALSSWPVLAALHQPQCQLGSNNCLFVCLSVNFANSESWTNLLCEWRSARSVLCHLPLCANV